MTKDEIIKQLLDEKKIRVDLDRGLVFSNRRSPDRPLGSKTTDGYLSTKLRFRGRHYHAQIHRIVAIAANGVPEPGLDTAHLNHVRTDNRAANLAFVTRKENLQQSREDGRIALGEKNGKSKLSIRRVAAIKAALASSDVTQRELAEEHGVDPSTISYIACDKTWGYVEPMPLPS